MQQAESVDGLRNVIVAVATLVIALVATSLVYRHKAEPRHSCPHAHNRYTPHLEYDVHALHSARPNTSIVIDLR